MTTIQETISDLDIIANAVKPLDNSRFIQLEYQDQGELKKSWVYPEPLKASREIGFTNKKEVIVTLDPSYRTSFPEQLILYRKIEEKLGLKIRHADLKEDFQASHSKETNEYREKVQIPFWIFNRQLIIRTNNNYNVRRVLGIRYIDEEILKNPEEVPQNMEISDIFILGPILQNDVSKKKGNFDDFNVVPVRKDIKGFFGGKGKGDWGGISFDKKGLSIARSYWDSISGIFRADAMKPVDNRVIGSVLPIWTDENPKR